MDNLTLRNIRLIEEIKNFAPKEMLGFLNNLISVEERFETVRRMLDYRKLPSPSQTYDMSFCLTDMCQSYLIMLNNLGNTQDYADVAKIFKNVYTYLKTDRDTKNSLVGAYTVKNHSASIKIYHYFGTHLLEIHRMLLNTLFKEYEFFRKEFMKRFIQNSVVGIKMLPDNFNPESNSSLRSSLSEDIGTISSGGD